MLQIFIRRSIQSILFLLLTLVSTSGWSASKVELDAKVASTLETFYDSVAGSKDMVKRAKGVLVFPEISKAGYFFLGGEYGEGALVENGFVDSYYSVAGGSLGPQLGIQVYSEIILFLTDKALADFKASKGWDGGVEGSVAAVTTGIGGQVDSKTVSKPVVIYVFDNKGLMANVNLAVTKITKISK